MSKLQSNQKQRSRSSVRSEVFREEKRFCLDLGANSPTTVPGSGHHPVDELPWEQGEQVSGVERVPGVPLQGAGLVRQGRLNEARVHVGLQVTTVGEKVRSVIQPC